MSLEPKLYFVSNGKALPTEVCYTVEKINDLIEYYGSDSGQILAAIHSYYSLNPEVNLYAHLPEEDRWKEIVRGMLGGIRLKASIVDPAKDVIAPMYNSAPYKVYKAFKGLMDKLSVAIEDVEPNLSKDFGNMMQIKQAVGSYKELKIAYSESYQEYMKSIGGGEMLAGRDKGYDEDGDDDEDDDD